MSYQVLFSGELADGAQEAAVRVNLARKLGLDDRKVDALFTGRTVVLKSQLKRDAALDLQAELSAMGALVRVKDLSPDDNRAKFKIDNKAPDQTLKDITAAHVECPRCGHLQLEAAHCARCGVDMRAATQQKNKEDLLIEKKIRALRGESVATPTPAQRKKRVLISEDRRPKAPAAAAPERKPRPYGKKKGWLSKLTGR